MKTFTALLLLCLLCVGAAFFFDGWRFGEESRITAVCAALAIAIYSIASRRKAARV